MSIALTTASPRVSVASADDPYKKYWLAIVAGFGLTAAWLLFPTMGTQVGSVSVKVGGPGTDSGAEQSLDSPYNPNGAPGGALDISADAKKGAAGDNFSPSMLYQPPPQDKTAASPAAAGAATSASANLAQQLKAVGKKDASGWGGEKAQRGFTMPHLSGGGFSGLGSSSGGSSASASIGGGMGAFGSRNAAVGSAATHGLRDDGSSALSGAAGGLAALGRAAKQTQAAAKDISGDAAAGKLNSLFDGSKGRTNSIGAGGGALGGAYAALDTSAPKNLKLNDPKIDEKKLEAPPSAPVQTKANNNAMLMQLGFTLVGACLGGVVGGTAGQMIAMAAMQAGQQQMQQQQQQAQQEAQAQQQYVQSLRNSVVR